MNERWQKDEQEDELLLIEFVSRKGKYSIIVWPLPPDEKLSKNILSTNFENICISQKLC